MRYIRAFTLVEVLIVVTILGILAAIVFPEYRSHAQQAKESAAKEDLQILRSAIERYAIQHDGIAPGYPDNDPSSSPSIKPFTDQMVRNGSYLSEIPSNPLNDATAIKMVYDDETFPAEPLGTDFYGWIYQPATKTIKLNSPGTDSQGVAYFDY